MRECWLTCWTKDGGKTWNPATDRFLFREADGKKEAEKFAKEAKGLYPYRAFKFIREDGANPCKR